jgi:hypothetical protein
MKILRFFMLLTFFTMLTPTGMIESSQGFDVFNKSYAKKKKAKKKDKSSLKAKRQSSNGRADGAHVGMAQLSKNKRRTPVCGLSVQECCEKIAGQPARACKSLAANNSFCQSVYEGKIRSCEGIQTIGQTACNKMLNVCKDIKCRPCPKSLKSKR